VKLNNVIVGQDLDYTNSKASSGGYLAQANPKPAYPPKKPVKPAEPSIRVSVNPASKLKAKQLANLLNTINELPGEFKDKIKAEGDFIRLPDLSANKPEPGKEWIYDLGKAGNGWEVTTATLRVGLERGTYYELMEHVQEGEERGRVLHDKDKSVLRVSRDMDDINAGLLLALTVPTEELLARKPQPPSKFPPEVARLKSNKGLIIIAFNAVAYKNLKETVPPIPIPNSMMVMSFLHEVSAHASYFSLGQNAAHSFPSDPANNPVDRNQQQTLAQYLTAMDADMNAFQAKLKVHITAMSKQ
jgi:hypothetical protein